MNIEIKKSTKPVNILKAIDFLEKRLIEINHKKKNELIWILEHPSRSLLQLELAIIKMKFLDKRIKLIKTNRGGKITMAWSRSN